MLKKQLQSEIKNLEKEIISWRRHFHKNPELSNQEVETSKKVQTVLEQYGITVRTGFAKTGVLGIIKGGKPGKTVALRADMDALPIQEQNEHNYVSTKKGIMHACGHDAHTAMLLGTGVALQKFREQLSGTVLLVFQPAEERAPLGGAQEMMDDGVFKEYRPDVIFGQHVWPDLPLGKIGVCAGPMMGNSDRFSIEVNGSGGHASMPHQTVDAIVVANQIISGIQTIVSRNVDPLKSAVITIGKITGGDRYNVIANRVILEGTLRTFDEDVKKLAKDRLHQLTSGVAESMGANAKVNYYDGYPATVNDPEWAEQVQISAQTVLGESSTPTVNPSLGGEDFGRFLLHYPGAYFWLGTAIETRKIQKPLHDPQFEIDERALVIGANVMTTVAIDALEKLSTGKEERYDYGT